MFFKKKSQGLETQTIPGKKKKKGKKKIIIVLIVLLLIVVAVIRCSNSKSTVTTVEVTNAVYSNISSDLDTSGIIDTQNSKVFTSPVAATVSKVNVKVGDLVNTGDFLVTYDTASLESNYDLASLEVKATKASETDSVNKSSQAQKDKASAQAVIDDMNNQINAKNDEIGALNATLVGYQQQSNSVAAQLEQYTTKVAAGALTAEEQQTYDNLKKQSTDLANAIVSAQADASTKQTQLADLQSKLAEAQTKKQTADADILSGAQKENLDYNTQKTQLTLSDAKDDLSKAQAGIAAEFSGIVTSVDITDGAQAQEGQSLITVADASNMMVECKVSKYNLEDLAIGQAAEVTFLDKTYKGSVTTISHVAAQGASSGTSTATASATSSTMVPVYIHLDNPDSNLILGMDTKVKILLGTKEHVLVVPMSCVNTDTKGEFVYVVKDNKIARKDVTTGMSNDENIEIVSGIKESDSVITSVDSSLQEGLTVVAKAQKAEKAKQSTETSTDTNVTEKASTTTTTDTSVNTTETKAQ